MATSLGNSSGDFDHYRITTYAVGLTLVYDQNGEADVEIATREHKSELERGFREVLNRLENGSYAGIQRKICITRCRKTARLRLPCQRRICRPI